MCNEWLMLRLLLLFKCGILPEIEMLYESCGILPDWVLGVPVFGSPNV